MSVRVNGGKCRECGTYHDRWSSCEWTDQELAEWRMFRLCKLCQATEFPVIQFRRKG